MIMKKITAAVCCAALTLSVFSGCNSSGGITVNQGAPMPPANRAAPREKRRRSPSATGGTARRKRCLNRCSKRSKRKTRILR